MTTDERFVALELKLDNLAKAVIDLSKFVHKGFGKIDENFEVVDKKLDFLAKSATTGFDSVGEKIDQLKEEVHKIQKVSNYNEQYENLLSIIK